MDEIDIKLMALLQRDNHGSTAQLAEGVGLSVSAAGERVRRLVANGMVAANRSILDASRLGLRLVAFIFVDLEPRSDEAAFTRAADQMDEVLEAHHVSGSHSWLLKVKVRDTSDLQSVLTALKLADGVARTESIVVLATAKETTQLPLNLVLPSGLPR